MEKNLEHKTAEAFQNKDGSTNYPRKDELWNRISTAQKGNLGVHGFWRIAAVLFALFFITGAFSSILFINKKTNQLTQSGRMNVELQHTIDSLMNSIPETITEIKYIEKEVKVFVPVEKKSERSELEKGELLSLKKENIQLQEQFKTEMKNWRNKTDSLVQDLLVLNKMLEQNKSIANEEENSAKKVVELKTENYAPPLQQTTKSNNPKMKIQLFSNPAEKTNFDMNSSILKK